MAAGSHLKRLSQALWTCVSRPPPPPPPRYIHFYCCLLFQSLSLKFCDTPHRGAEPQCWRYIIIICMAQTDCKPKPLNLKLIHTPILNKKVLLLADQNCRCSFWSIKGDSKNTGNKLKPEVHAGNRALVHCKIYRELVYDVIQKHPPWPWCLQPHCTGF